MTICVRLRENNIHNMLTLILLSVLTRPPVINNTDSITVNVAEAGTNTPLRDVTLSGNSTFVTQTTWDGKARVPRKAGRITVAKPGYMTLTIRPEEIKDTIHMLRDAYRLDEVVVWGNRKSMSFIAPIDHTTAGLISNSEAANRPALDVLGAAVWIIGKLLPTRSKESKKAKRKRIISQY